MYSNNNMEQSGFYHKHIYYFGSLAGIIYGYPVTNAFYEHRYEHLFEHLYKHFNEHLYEHLNEHPYWAALALQRPCELGKVLVKVFVKVVILVRWGSPIGENR